MALGTAAPMPRQKVLTSLPYILGSTFFWHLISAKWPRQTFPATLYVTSRLSRPSSMSLTCTRSMCAFASLISDHDHIRRTLLRGCSTVEWACSLPLASTFKSQAGTKKRPSCERLRAPITRASEPVSLDYSPYTKRNSPVDCDMVLLLKSGCGVSRVWDKMSGQFSVCL